MSAKVSTFTSAAACALLLAATSCSKKEEPKAPAIPEVSVSEVIQRDVPIGGELTGTLRGFEDVEIRARVEGYLKSMDYKEGSEVKKGQLLFTIDDQPYRAKLAEAKGELARAQASFSKADLDVKRFRPLAAERAISQAELDNALAAQRATQAQVEAAKANAEQASLNLGYTRIAAPVDGLAGRAERKVGDLVGKGEPTLLTTISSIDPIRVSVNIPEALYLRYADRVPGAADGGPAAKPPPPKPGEEQGPQLVLADGSVYPERGKIVLVDRAVDPTTGTLRVDLAFANPKKTLRPGLYGKVRYRDELRSGALLVPQRAVQELQGQYTVVVVNAEGKAETRKVKPGPRAGSLWILDEGVKPGEKVIVEGVQKVRDGVPVKATVVPAEPPAAAQPAPPGAATGPAGAPAGAPAPTAGQPGGPAVPEGKPPAPAPAQPAQGK
ncbi:MAG TPA: efflux RND transporter periplasmic adaptor subunit [Anaeromyxobacteraceae bacterium]|nr:efflux RND transporter periplasmic adaptor subunit [Anaeromyxobacteraceae bacterium]